MPRKPFIRCSRSPYHITNRSNNQEFFYLDNEDLWKIFLRCLERMNKLYKCEVHAFVLMSNHYHLLVHTPEANIGDAMKYLHREVARHANRNAGRINQLIELDLDWLDEPFLKEHEVAIKKALRRREFALPRKSGCRRQGLAAARYKKGTVTL